jgi:hypothetical protein
MTYLFQGMGWENIVCLALALMCFRFGVAGGKFRAFRSGEPIPERQGQFLSFMTGALFLSFALFVRHWHFQL